MKGQKRKVMSVNVALIQQHIPRDVGGSGSGWRETGAVSDSLIGFYYLFEFRTRCWLADLAARRHGWG